MFLGLCISATPIGYLIQIDFAVCVQGDYQTLVQQVLQSNHDNPATYQRLADAFNAVVTTNGVTLSISSRNTMKFKSNLRQLLLNVRGFMRIK
jgi:hypothetical protein